MTSISYLFLPVSAPIFADLPETVFLPVAGPYLRTVIDNEKNPSSTQSTMQQTYRLFSTNFRCRLVLHLPIVTRTVAGQQFRMEHPDQVFQQVIGMQRKFLIIRDKSRIAGINPAVLKGIEVLVRRVFGTQVTVGHVFGLVILNQPHIGMDSPVEYRLESQRRTSGSGEFLET